MVEGIGHRLRPMARVLLAAFMVAAGVGHFVSTETFLAQVPPWLPARLALIQVSGVAELTLGVGLLLPQPWQRRAGWALAAFLVAVFPGNVYQAVAGTDAFGLDTPTARWTRLLAQPLLVALALWSTGARREDVHMSQDHHHPLFARIYRRAAPMWERRGGSEQRALLLAGLSGRVLEIGCGLGGNFRYYPTAVHEVLAVEPEPRLRAAAEQAAAAAPVPVVVVPGVAEALPADDGAFDAVVLVNVLCSIDDPRRALAEIGRVLRPGGTLHFLEHVAVDEGPLARWQRVVNPIWPWFAGGCQVTRDSLGAITDAGFVVDHVERFTLGLGPLLAPLAPTVTGVARPPRVTG